MHPVGQLLTLFVSVIPFNSRSLGFFHASQQLNGKQIRCLNLLSIPVPWDFSMHLQSLVFLPLFSDASSFNSRSLGFFHASFTILLSIFSANSFFQFPFLGIFPCIAENCVICLFGFVLLSIPVPWDFSMHLMLAGALTPCVWPFNSRSLGFFHASHRKQA